MEPDPKPRILPGEVDGLRARRFVYHQARGREDPFTMRANHSSVYGFRPPKIVGIDDQPSSRRVSSHEQPGPGMNAIRPLRPIGRSHRPGDQTEPRAKNQENLLAFVEARQLWSKNVETVALELAQQPPINRAHQLRGCHRPAVSGREGRACQAIEMTRPLRHARGHFKKAWRVFTARNFVRRNLEPRQLT